jgi:hypothetical protein
MTDDQLLRDLGDLERERREAERARWDERWDRLAAGTLTAGEEAELKALAASSPEAREAYEAFRPLGAGFQARVVDAINAERTGGVPPPRVLPFRRVARRAEVWVGLAAAVAACLFLLVRGPAVAPLPGYTAELTGGAQVYRGKETSPSRSQVFIPGSPLTLTVTPQTAVQGAVGARVFLESLGGSGDLRAWEPEPRLESTDQGTVRLQGTLGQEIQLPPGDWRIWAVVGRKGAIPSVRRLRTELRAGRTRGDGWQAVSADLRVAAHAPP